MMSNKILRIFLVIGLCLGAGAIYSGYKNWLLVHGGVTAPGVVLSNEQHLSTTTDSKGRTTSTMFYYPVVRFTDTAGSVHTFTGSIGSGNSPSFAESEAVEVIYPPGKPEKAGINTFMEVWFVTCILAFMSVIFTAIGYVFIRLLPEDDVQKIAENFLPKFGVTITANITDISQAGKASAEDPNAQEPWIIKAEWRDEKSGKTHCFVSNPIPGDPRGMVGATIPVKMLPNMPGMYEMDIANLTRNNRS